MPGLPKGAPTPLSPSLSVLFSPLHSCVPMAMGVSDNIDLGWLGGDKM